MTTPLLPSFNEWFQDVWGHAPYPWQARLAREVVANGFWPDVIGVPTGTGKTSTLDIALYALAAEAHLPPSERHAPRRVVMVVDRRTVVDQSYDRAIALRDHLMAATDGPSLAIAQRLRSLMGQDAGQEAPLAVSLLRGGVPRDDGFLRRPDQAAIVLSTVDQVGSRLLFRGYGVRPTMAPVHAGMLGHDALLLLDEVHLARPFEETLTALERKWRSWHESELPDRWRFVRLSATSGASQVFQLDQDDLTNEHLITRLAAPKTITVQAKDFATHKAVKDAANVPSDAWLKALAAEVKALTESGAKSVGVVVNRVDVAVALASLLSDDKRLDTALLTGRMRLCDRDDVLQEVVRRAGPDRDLAAQPERPFVCVATQCIEAGADLDFDAMVTELASLDALVQRVGRVNRTGRQERAPITVLAPKISDKPDPVYGSTLRPTLDWLLTRGDAFDASPGALTEALQSAHIDVYPEQRQAAVLLPAHLDLLSQTSPVPEPDPDPAHYLRGLEPPRPEVQVVWRADITPAGLERAAQGDDALGALRELLAAVPPSSFEAVALPIGACAAWLDGRNVPSYSDTGQDDPEDNARVRDAKRPLGIVQRGGGFELLASARLRPGDVIIVPATRGGLARGNFDPSAHEPVRDWADLGQTLRSGRPTLRLDARVYGEPGADGQLAWPAGLTSPPAPPDGETGSLAGGRKDVMAWLAANRDSKALGGLLTHLRRPAITPIAGCWLITGAPLPLHTLLRLTRGGAIADADGSLTGGASSSHTGVAVPLVEHLAGVSAWARSLAERCGLPAAVVNDLALAGALHDIGKADPRFQVVLHGGDEIEAASGVPLAKSAGGPSDAGARARARARANLPAGFRHESASVALLTHTANGGTLLTGCGDPDLVLHLVASHHGYARPFAAIEDHRGQRAITVSVTVGHVTVTAPGDHGMDALGSGVSDRFWRLQRKYGWWGLAWLEAILRLADHRRSEAESRTPSEAS